MFYYWHVYIVDEKGNTTKHIDLVRAISESSAVEQSYMKFGSASKYSGLGKHSFKAVRA